MRENTLKYAKEPILKVNSSLSEWGKDFIELKDREVRMKREIEKLFFKPIMVSIDDMDNF